jgi:hypothetical protein
LSVVTRIYRGPRWCHIAPQRTSAQRSLCRQALATFCPAPRDHPRSPDSGHTLAEPVPPLTHEPARLVGPFHGQYSIFSRWLQPCRNTANGPAHAFRRRDRPHRPKLNGAAYRGPGTASQLHGPCRGLTLSAPVITKFHRRWSYFNSA